MNEKVWRIVITGPTGAIGVALIEKCIKEKIEVLAICHRNSRRIANIPIHPLVKILERNLDELSTIEAEPERYDAFYHLGWRGTFGDTRNDMPLQIQNIQYTLDAVNLAEKLGCTTFIGAGSQAEYGRVEGVLKPELKTNPENGYGMAKLCAGQMSRLVCEQKNLCHIWTRILSVYGPYDGENTMVMSTLRKLSRGEKTSFTRGEQLWDYLYSEDAAEALYLLGKKGRHGKVYCIGSGQARPLKEYIEIMGRIVGAEKVNGLGELPYGARQVMHLEADITELMKDTGFCVKIPFEEGCRKTLDKLTALLK